MSIVWFSSMIGLAGLSNFLRIYSFRYSNRRKFLVPLRRPWSPHFYSDLEQFDDGSDFTDTILFIKLFDFPPDYQSLYINKPQRSRRHYTHCKLLHEAHYIMNIRHPFVIVRSLLLLEYSLITITVTLIV